MPAPKSVHWKTLPKDAVVTAVKGRAQGAFGAPSGYRVKLTDGSFAGVDWTGQEAAAAQRFLDARVKATIMTLGQATAPEHAVPLGPAHDQRLYYKFLTTFPASNLQPGKLSAADIGKAVGLPYFVHADKAHGIVSIHFRADSAGVAIAGLAHLKRIAKATLKAWVADAKPEIVSERDPWFWDSDKQAHTLPPPFKRPK